MRIPIAWLQLKKDRWRLLVAIGGVAFAVILVFMQMGFRDALFTSAVRMHSLFRYDLAMISPRTPTLIGPAEFDRDRVAQVRGFEGVRSAEMVNLDYTHWKNPAKPEIRRTIYTIGFDPSTSVIDIPEVDAQRHGLGAGHGEAPVLPPGEGEPGRDRVLGGEPAGRVLGDVVAQAVGHPLAVDALDGLHDVRVVTQDEVDVGRGEQRADRLDLGL